MRLLLCLPPARLSHELDTLRRIPGADIALLSDRHGWPVERAVVRPVIRVPYLGSYQRWTSALAWYRDLGSVELADVDAVLSFELFSVTSAQATSLAQRLGVAHVVWVAANRHDHPIYRLPPWKGLTKKTIRRIDGVVCTSGLSAQHAIRLGLAEHQVRVVAPGVDCDVFRPRSAGLQLRPRIVFVGELRPDKGIDDIVAACDLLVGRGVKVDLTIIGDGELRRQVNALADDRSWVTVAGRLPREEVAGAMRDARVLVLASRRTWWEFEQMPFTLMEALASGVAVVATRCGGNPEIVPSWNALVPQRDPEAMADGILRALGPAGDDWGARNRADAMERFEVGRQAQRLGDAIASFANATTHPS